MGLWSRLRNAVRREQPTSRLMWFAPDQPTGIFITPENALDVSVVWACVEAISTSLAASRWNVMSGMSSAPVRTRLPDDRLDYVLNVRPNPEMTAIAMREALGVQALTWGNAYAEIVPNARGDIAEIWPLFTDRMTPRRGPEGLYYEYVYADGAITPMPRDRVFHLHGAGIAGLLGDNIVARMAKTVSLAAAQERYASSYFGNNTVIGGVLSHPKKLSPSAHDILKKDWEDKYKGPFKANKPIILEEGMTWTPFDNNAEHAQLVESRMFQIEEICRWYRVPPHKVAHLARATLNNIEQLGIEFVRDALTPWARRFEQEADFKLLPQRAPWRSTSIDMAWLTQGDFKTRTEGYAVMRNIGAYSVNQILQKEGESPIGPDGDTRIVQANMVKLEDIGKQPAGSPGSQPGADSQEAAMPRQPAKDMANSLARDAVVVLFASVLDRHRKRLRAREEDLLRGGKSPQAISAAMAKERERLRPKLSEECAEAILLLERHFGAGPKEEEILASADAVERGEDPKAVATRLLPAGNAVVQGAM